MISKITPNNSAVSTSILGQIYGTEKEDGTANPIQNINYSVSTGSQYSRYSYITFSDAESPKRFNDIVLSISQCTGTTDLTLKGYKNVWEDIYGIDPNNDEPNTDGNLATNTNKTRWHYANPETPSDNEIFFSSEFGDAGRWMTTNLVTSEYPTRTDGTSMSGLPTLTLNYNNSITAAYWGYPGADVLNFNNRQRVGYLYNWYAATGGRIEDGADPVNQPNVQGICPKGWHLPSYTEWLQLLDVIKVNPQLSSEYTISNNSSTFFAMKDKCEIPANQGKSFDVLKGGFAFLLTGGFENGAQNWWTTESVWWTSTSINSTYANYITFFQSMQQQGPGTNPKQRGFAVRCKKD